MKTSKIVVCSGFCAPAFICKLQSEFAHDSSRMKAILDKLNTIIIDFSVYRRYSVVAVCLIIGLALCCGISLLWIEKTGNINAHEMNLHSGLPFGMVLWAGEDTNIDAWHITCRGWMTRSWVDCA